MLETDNKITAYKPLNLYDSSLSKIFVNERFFGTQVNFKADEEHLRFQLTQTSDRPLTSSRQQNSNSIYQLESRTNFKIKQNYHD